MGSHALALIARQPPRTDVTPIILPTDIKLTRGRLVICMTPARRQAVWAFGGAVCPGENRWLSVSCVSVLSASPCRIAPRGIRVGRRQSPLRPRNPGTGCRRVACQPSIFSGAPRAWIRSMTATPSSMLRVARSHSGQDHDVTRPSAFGVIQQTPQFCRGASTAYIKSSMRPRCRSWKTVTP